MKKMIAFILTLAAVFSLAACGSGTAEVVTVPTETPAAEVTPTAETPAVESGEAWYELQNDDTILTVRLPSNPSTGYDWSYEISNDQAIELLTQEYVQDEAAPDAVGVGGTWVASFANFGSAFGEVTISFRYAQLGGQRACRGAHASAPHRREQPDRGYFRRPCRLQISMPVPPKHRTLALMFGWNWCIITYININERMFLLWQILKTRQCLSPARQASSAAFSARLF